MIKNYFKIAWRNLIQDKSFTFINLLGLATGFAITLLIVQYVRFEFSYENTHINADRLVRLTMDYMDGETVDRNLEWISITFNKEMFPSVSISAVCVTAANGVPV